MPGLIKPQTNGTTGPPYIYDNRSRSAGKNIALQHIFLPCSVEFNSGQQCNIMDKDTRGKEKTCAQKVKGGKHDAEKQDGQLTKYPNFKEM